MALCLVLNSGKFNGIWEEMGPNMWCLKTQTLRLGRHRRRRVEGVDQDQMWAHSWPPNIPGPPTEPTAASNPSLLMPLACRQYPLLDTAREVPPVSQEQL